jgi:DNA-binding NtrC family response regulator
MVTPGIARISASKAIAISFGDPAAAPSLAPLQTTGFRVTVIEDPGQLAALISGNQVDGVVIELGGLDKQHRMTVLKDLRQLHSSIPLIAAVPAADVALRAQALASGATDVIASPLSTASLHGALLRRFYPEKTAASSMGRRSLGPLIGASEPMQRLYDTISRVAGSNTTLLIRGESGTGKELVARTIVALSARRDKPFIRLNCAALPENLIESELFGSERGAYTGAVTARPGHIEMAHGGTLFLDEIATLPLAVQTKLLRVIEDRAVQRLGSSASKTIDFRLLTATNEDLEQMVKAGRFREDLYYRIHVMPINVPALRERKDDIAVLANHFLHVHCTANSIPVKRLELEALEVLEDSPWKGNIRELENLIQRLVLMVEGPSISVDHLPEQILVDSTARQESLLIPGDGIDFDHEMERIEVAYLQAALRRSHGKKNAAAALLRMNIQRMKYLCRKYHLSRELEGE